MSARKPRPRRETPVNPPGFLATQDLKDRGWTPALIGKFLGEHDATRQNGLRMGRRRLPPVKLYLETRVTEVERQDSFLAAQARAADARERAERARASREANRRLLLQAAADSYVPVIHPEPLRKGAVRKAREPYLMGLEQKLQQLCREIPRCTAKDEAQLSELLRERLDIALAGSYDWYPLPGAAPGKGGTAAPSKPGKEAKPSDWRNWDWD